MDIHPPTGTLHSLRDYCTHLSMVVIGILIALSLENALEKHHAHQLATRAVRDMLAEIRSNRAQIEGSLSGLERVKTQIEQQLDEQKKAIEAQRNHAQPPPEIPVKSNALAFPGLSSAAWDSALAMQAVGRINVDAAEILSRIYSNQIEVKDLQKTFLGVALHFETYAGRSNNDTAERMLDRLGALQQLSTALENLLNSYRELLSQYATSKQAGLNEASARELETQQSAPAGRGFDGFPSTKSASLSSLRRGRRYRLPPPSYFDPPSINRPLTAEVALTERCHLHGGDAAASRPADRW